MNESDVHDPVRFDHDEQAIRIVLRRMAELLRGANHNDWATACERHSTDMEASPAATTASIASIRATFGGAGSLNDLVLYQNGQLLSAENEEFDNLRLTLFSLCAP